MFVKCYRIWKSICLIWKKWLCLLLVWWYKVVFLVVKVIFIVKFSSKISKVSVKWWNGKNFVVVCDYWIIIFVMWRN